jgi:hypothetical protein
MEGTVFARLISAHRWTGKMHTKKSLKYSLLGASLLWANAKVSRSLPSTPANFFRFLLPGWMGRFEYERMLAIRKPQGTAPHIFVCRGLIRLACGKPKGGEQDDLYTTLSFVQLKINPVNPPLVRSEIPS